MNVYIYIHEPPKTPFHNRLLEFMAPIDDTLRIPLDTTPFRCYLYEADREALNAAIIDTIGGNSYIQNGVIELSFADIKRLGNFIYSKSPIPEDSLKNITSLDESYEYLVAEDRYESMAPHQQSASQSHSSQQTAFDDLFALLSTPASHSATYGSEEPSNWNGQGDDDLDNWFLRLEEGTSETPTGENLQSPTTTALMTTTTTITSTASTCAANPIYELQDETFWEHNLDNGLVTLISHPEPAITFKSEFALRIINANALDAQKKEDLSDIVFSNLPLQEFQLSINDFCMLYTEADFLGIKPPVKMSQALETGTDTINESLEDLYDFIERACPELPRQQQLLNTLLKIKVESSSEQVAALLTKIKAQFTKSETTNSFMNSISYFATGLRGLDELKLLESIFAKEVGHNRTQIHNLYRGFIAEKLAAIVDIIKAKNRQEIIVINDEPSPSLLYRSQHKRGRQEDSARDLNTTHHTTTSTSTSISPEKRPRY